MLRNRIDVLAVCIIVLAIALFGLMGSLHTNQAHAAPATQNITGYLDGLHPTLSPRLYGWTADRNNQQKQLQVELWYGPTEKFSDAKLAGTVTAGLDSGDYLLINY